jgi:hypothetical protein
MAWMAREKSGIQPEELLAYDWTILEYFHTQFAAADAVAQLFSLDTTTVAEGALGERRAE